MTAMERISEDSPLMKAWGSYTKSAEYANTKRWALHPEHVDGSLWAAFLAGFSMATERAASLHESVDPASDEERALSAPGAGAMAAVVEYRDLIRRAR